MEHEELKFKRYELDPNKMYELDITMSNGENINFDRYEGYFTLIIPVAKTCNGMQVKFSDIVQQIRSLKQLPKIAYAVEILVFPYEYNNHDGARSNRDPKANNAYYGKDCSDFEIEYSKDRNGKHPIYMMQMGEFIGDNVPPIFQTIQEAMCTETLVNDSTAFFLIYPEWNTLEYHYGKSLLDMKDILLEVTKVLENKEL